MNKHGYLKLLEQWQEVVDLLAEIIDVPSALVMHYKDGNLEVLVASNSEGNPYKSGDSEVMEGSGLYCETVIKTNKLLTVPNALKSKRWRENPDIALNMISYLGLPILKADGSPFGTICVLDHKENTYSGKFIKLLEKFRSFIELELNLLDKEAELRIEAAAFESLEGMMITDSEGMVLKINEAFTEITGYSEKDIIGETPKLLQSGDHDANFYKSLWDCLKQTGRWEGEINNRHKKGHSYFQRLTITAVKDTNGIITNYVATHMDITKSKAQEREINRLAFFDQLTELPNRRLFIDRFNQALKSCARNKKEGALLFLDLNKFKLLNDTLGHDAGDILLQQVSKRLIQTVREGDTVARIGGDEFVVLLENLNTDSVKAVQEATGVVNKIISSLGKPYQLSSHEHFSSASIGVTLFGSEKSIDILMKRADIAMYEVKANEDVGFLFYKE